LRRTRLRFAAAFALLRSPIAILRRSPSPPLRAPTVTRLAQSLSLRCHGPVPKPRSRGKRIPGASWAVHRLAQTPEMLPRKRACGVSAHPNTSHHRKTHQQRPHAQGTPLPYRPITTAGTPTPMAASAASLRTRSSNLTRPQRLLIPRALTCSCEVHDEAGQANVRPATRRACSRLLDVCFQPPGGKAKRAAALAADCPNNV
jgi:hypothetical protein